MAHPPPPPVTIGVDTHKDSHVAAARDQQGRRLATTQVAATRAGYTMLLAWARSLGEPVAWGVEGTGSYGPAWPASWPLTASGCWRSTGPTGPPAGGTARATRWTPTPPPRAVQAGEATGTPKTQDGTVEMLRALRVARQTAVKARTQAINALKGLLVTAPDELREQLGGPDDIWRGSQENVIGILHAKDLLNALARADGKIDAFWLRLRQPILPP